jgi:hypothetical protein
MTVREEPAADALVPCRVSERVSILVNCTTRLPL